ncbi:MAG: ABC transporter permease [Candidatus Peribacteria bacterium]|nr:ABC transporter permease [Candidatus Peribacteria bacterium]
MFYLSTQPMTFLSYFKDARSSIIANKLRSSLSMLGIVIGVSSVIILMAFGAGTQQQMLNQMASLINNNLSLSTKGGNTVRTNEDVKGYVKAITLTPELAQEIEENFPQLSGAVTYGTTTMGQASYDSNIVMSSFAGVPMDYLKKMELSLALGREFDQLDFDSASEVAIVNKNVIEALFRNKNPLGEKITMNNKEYTIIGTLSDSSMMGQIFIPLPTYRKKVAGNKNISTITIKLDAEANNTEWQARVQYFLLRKFNVKHLDLAGFSLSSTAAVGDVVSSMMTMMNIFLGAIGGISLLVGGIGVMNIMLVSVTERTREI